MFPCVALGLVVAVADVHNTDKKEIFYPGMYLVRAKAQTVSYPKGHARCIFVIEHVYVGADGLKGERFEAWNDRPLTFGLGSFGNWATPMIKKGEVSIWWIADRPAKKNKGTAGKQPDKKPRFVAAEHNPTTARHVSIYFPARRILRDAKGPDDDWDRDGEWHKNAEKYYSTIGKFAARMERVYKASPKEQESLLKKFGRSDVPMLQEWSIDRLKCALSAVDYVAYLKDLASSVPLPLLMEHEIDCDLSELSSTWRNSAARLKFFQRWANGTLSDGQADIEENHIEYILVRTNYDGVPYPTFLRLMIDGLTTDRRSEDFKRRLVKYNYYMRGFNRHGHGAKELASIDAGFTYLLSQVHKSALKRRIAAAQLLVYFVPLCNAQETAVKTLFDDPVNKPIASHLKHALQQTTVVLDGLSGNDGSKVSEDDKEFLWAYLLSVASNSQAVRFIREHVRPSPAIDPARVKQCVRDLDNDKFHHREAASRQLWTMGLEAEPILRDALASTNSAEVRRRLNSLLTQFKKERIITLRTIPILAKMETPEARTLLQTLASGFDGAQITREAKKAIKVKEP